MDQNSTHLTAGFHGSEAMAHSPSVEANSIQLFDMSLTRKNIIGLAADFRRNTANY